MTAPSTLPAPPRRVVVVGAGLAGLRTVAELRGQGFDGEITVVGAEHLPPYDRPPLTKELFARPEPLWLADEGYGDLSALADHVLLGHRATALEAADDGAHLTVTGAAGPREVAGDVVVLAVGARPIVPPGWQGPVSLHNADDAAHLREQLVPGSRLLIVGGGWIGAELATVATARDIAVTVVEAGPAPLTQVLGPDVSARLLRWYAEHGVELRTGVPVTEVTGTGALLADGTELAADVVVVAIGVRPNTEWLDGALPLTTRHAIPVDLAGRVAGGPASVRAVGDCADRTSPRDGLLPGAHWDGALGHPAAVVAGLLGEPAGAPDPAPYVFSTQLGHELTMVGAAPPGAEVVLRGDPEAGPWTALYVQRGPEGAVLRAGFTVDRPRDVGALRKALSGPQHPAIDLAAAADPTIALRKTLTGR